MNRKAVAVLIFVLWAAGVGWMLTRNLGGDQSRRLTEAAVRVQPSTYYYALFFRGQKIGAAYSAIDTLVSAFVSEEYFTGRFPLADSLVPVSARLRTRLSRGFRLTDISLDLERAGLKSKMSAFVQSDTTLIVTERRSADSAVSHVFGLHGALLPPGLLGVALILGEAPKAGRRERFFVFNPVEGKPEQREIEVSADSLFTVADSAARAPGGEWRIAHADTVRGWRLNGETSGLTVWVDAEGRAVEAVSAGGLLLRRTAYELAFDRQRGRGK